MEETFRSQANNQEADAGAEQILNEMPSFDEHMASVEQNKTFNEAKESGEVPQNVRDEQDWAEYLREKEARNREKQYEDFERAKKIDAIKNGGNRDLVVAFLPGLVGASFIQHSDQILDEIIGYEMGLDDADSDGDDLEKHLYTVGRDMIKKGDVEKGRAFKRYAKSIDSFSHHILIGSKVNREVNNLIRENRGYYEGYLSSEEMKKWAVNKTIFRILKREARGDENQELVIGTYEDNLEIDIEDCGDDGVFDEMAESYLRDLGRQRITGRSDSESLNYLVALQKLKDKFNRYNKDYISFKRRLEQGQELLQEMREGSF